MLTTDELREIWKATAEEGDYNEIVRLLMFTPQRREEIAAVLLGAEHWHCSPLAAGGH